MLSISPIINGRMIFYLDIKNSLTPLHSAQLKSWAVFVIADDIKNPILEEFADMCINKDVLYVCAAGKACRKIDDLFDMNMVIRRINGMPLPSWFSSDDDTLMTSWHHDFEEGFWFCTTVASYEDHIIETVLVANLSDSDYLPKISKLTKLVSDGWLPPD
jgi:hypothetical protein